MARDDRTLRAVFSAQANVDWHAIENLIKSLGGDISYGGGSLVTFSLNGLRGVFHSPHPQKEAKRYAVKKLRNFLRDAGVKP